MSQRGLSPPEPAGPASRALGTHSKVGEERQGEPRACPSARPARPLPRVSLAPGRGEGGRTGPCTHESRDPGSPQGARLGRAAPREGGRAGPWAGPPPAARGRRRGLSLSPAPPGQAVRGVRRGGGGGHLPSGKVSKEGGAPRWTRLTWRWPILGRDWELPVP